MLDENQSVFQTIDDVAVGEIRKKIKDILGGFMFGGEDIDKKVKVLSGGERSRLAMVNPFSMPHFFSNRITSYNVCYTKLLRH